MGSQCRYKRSLQPSTLDTLMYCTWAYDRRIDVIRGKQRPSLSMPNTYNHTGHWMAESEGRVQAVRVRQENQSAWMHGGWSGRSAGSLVSLHARYSTVATRRAHNECATAVGRHPGVPEALTSSLTTEPRDDEHCSAQQYEAAQRSDKLSQQFQLSL